MTIGRSVHSNLLALATGLPVAVSSVAWAQSDPLGEPFPAVFDLRALDGVIGIRIDGVDGGDATQSATGPPGDVNGDGLDDVFIGAPSADPGRRFFAGSSYLVFGRDGAASGGLPAAFPLFDLDGSNGFRIDGVEPFSFSGYSLALAGDVNGDGIDDLIVGAPNSDTPGYAPGATFVVFGKTATSGGFPASFQLSSLDGSNGFRINGIEMSDASGRSVAQAGDINGDGIDDVIIGARGADPFGRENAGSSYIVFGRDASSGASFPSILQLTDLDGSTGFRIAGSNARDYSGASVASAGDVNGDGIDDVIIGAIGADPGGRSGAGSSYVVFGRAVASGGFPSTLDLSSIDGSIGFRIDGVDPSDTSGRSVSSAGDINGDGVDDVIIGVRSALTLAGARAGVSFVVFGRDAASEPFPAAIQLEQVDGIIGFRIDGERPDDGSGSSVASAGDVNGDGLDDVIIGAPGADPHARADVGSSYVVFGRDVIVGSVFPALVQLIDLDGRNGFRIDGALPSSGSGTSVGAAGDFNGDGQDDLVIGAPRADVGGMSRTGSSYVVFGRGIPVCVADLDSDGTLTIFDFLEFSNLFNFMDPRADFDGDGDFTVSDFRAFQNAFDAGCP